jgi:hypothetical protein
MHIMPIDAHLLLLFLANIPGSIRFLLVWGISQGEPVIYYYYQKSSHVLNLIHYVDKSMYSISDVLSYQSPQADY